MAQPRNRFDLFGLDLRQLWEHWRQGCAEARLWPLFRRLLPAEPVRLLHPDGSESDWPARAGTARATPRTLAVLLPEAQVLRQRLQLPLLPAAQQAAALELAVRAASPFPPEATAWGCQVQAHGSGLQADIAIASRSHIATWLAQLFEDAPGEGGSAAEHPRRKRLPGQGVEVWADGAPFIPLTGYDEALRHARERRAHLHTAALSGLALILLLALAASPALHRQQQATEAEARLAALGREAAAAMSARDALGKTNLQLQTVAAYLAARPDPVQVLARLTVLLPDPVHLTRLEIRGHTVIIAGLADNAAGLMDTLGGRPDFHDVRAPSAITRDRATGRESFVIEFKLAEDAR